MGKQKIMEAERGLQVAWAAAETLQPYALDADLRRTSNDGLVTAFSHLRDAGQRAFLGMAVVVGIAQERAEHGSNVLDSLSAALGRHRSRIAVLGQIYRLIIRPRFLECGRETEFPLQEQIYYETAVRFAGRNAMGNADAHLLLTLAEDAKLEDGSFSGRAFIERIALAPEDDTRSMTSAVSSIDKIMRKLAKDWHDGAAAKWSEGVESPGQWAELLEGVGASMLRQAKQLRKRKR